jgi:hypothetical protein
MGRVRATVNLRNTLIGIAFVLFLALGSLRIAHAYYPGINIFSWGGVYADAGYPIAYDGQGNGNTTEVGQSLVETVPDGGTFQIYYDSQQSWSPFSLAYNSGGPVPFYSFSVVSPWGESVFGSSSYWDAVVVKPGDAGTSRADVYAAGVDTNIEFDVTSKGSGDIVENLGSGHFKVKAIDGGTVVVADDLGDLTAGAANRDGVSIATYSSGSNQSAIAAEGPDTNVALALQTQGNGGILTESHIDSAAGAMSISGPLLTGCWDAGATLAANSNDTAGTILLTPGQLTCQVGPGDGAGTAITLTFGTSYGSSSDYVVVLSPSLTAGNVPATLIPMWAFKHSGASFDIIPVITATPGEGVPLAWDYVTVGLGGGAH